MAGFHVVGDSHRAHSVGLRACAGQCAVHIVLFDESGRIYADAPMTPQMATRFGTALIRIGGGEDSGRVIDSMEHN